MSTYVSFCIHFPQFLANSSSFNFSLYVNFSIPWISSIIDSHCLHCGMSAFSQFFVIVFLLAVRRIFTRYRSSLATHSTKCPRYKTVHVKGIGYPRVWHTTSCTSLQKGSIFLQLQKICV